MNNLGNKVARSAGDFTKYHHLPASQAHGMMDVHVLPLVVFGTCVYVSPER